MGDERRTDQVDDWFAAAEHPQEEAMQAVRRITLDVSPEIGECIKWSIPTFTYKGNMFSFNRAKHFVSLLWHQGARIPGEVDGLEGEGDTARTMRFDDAADVEARADQLRDAVRAWMDHRDGG